MSIIKSGKPVKFDENVAVCIFLEGPFATHPQGGGEDTHYTGMLCLKRVRDFQELRDREG